VGCQALNRSSVCSRASTSADCRSAYSRRGFRPKHSKNCRVWSANDESRVQVRDLCGRQQHLDTVRQLSGPESASPPQAISITRLTAPQREARTVGQPSALPVGARLNAIPFNEPVIVDFHKIKLTFRCGSFVERKATIA